MATWRTDPFSLPFSSVYEPPQKLALAFSTADVVMLGWRLSHLADKLQENGLAAVRVLPKCFAEIDRLMPFVASIIITPVAKG